MKKIAQIAVIAVLAIGFTSCKKDYTCTCNDGAGGTDTYKFTKVKKKDAKSACDTWDSLYKIDGGSCSL